MTSHAHVTGGAGIWSSGGAISPTRIIMQILRQKLDFTLRFFACALQSAGTNN